MTAWRARMLVQSFAELPDTFTFQGHAGRARRYHEDSTGCLTTVVDLTLSDDLINAAYFAAIDIGAELTDCVGLLSYAPASYELLSVGPEISTIGVAFDMALAVGMFRRTRSTIDGKKLQALGDKYGNEGTAIALRSFRVGLGAKNPYRTLTELWTAAEALADRQARTDGNFIERRCDQCGKVSRAGPASQQYIRKYFERVTPVDKTADEYRRLADDTRSLRGTLAHGGKLHNEALRQEANVKLSSLQAAAAAAIVDATGVSTATHRCQHLGVPCLVIRLHRVGLKATDCAPAPSNGRSDELVFEIPAVLSFLPDEFSECQEFTIEVGVKWPIPVHELAFPEPGPAI